jgi:hypothetical protein
MISMNRSVRRVITGLNEYGQSTVVIDGTSAVGSHNVLTTASRCLTYIWRGMCGPAALDEVAETVHGGLTINPPAHGAVFRVIEIAPDQDAPNDHAAFFRAVSGEDTQTAGHSTHPGMHKTPTIDFLVVLRGEVWLLLECGETRLRTGDCLVQRGTIHAWINRTNESCQCAIVMLDAV